MRSKEKLKQAICEAVYKWIIYDFLIFGDQLRSADPGGRCNNPVRRIFVKVSRQIAGFEGYFGTQFKNRYSGIVNRIVKPFFR